MRKEVWFGLTIMAAVVIGVFVLMPAPSQMTNGHLGLLMLALIVVGIMLGFPTAFTLMGMGVFFGWLAYHSVDPAIANRQILDLMVQRAYSVMSNDVLIAIPLFVFMGYLVERAALIDRLFKSLHLATARVPGALAVATIVTCAIFATATGIVGAVVTLMGLLAFPAMLKAGYNTKVAAGAITAGGCLGILIPPSVLLIVYGAVAGVSVVQLYAGAFGPGFMLAGLYIGFVILLAKLRPDLMPPLPASERHVALPSFAQKLASHGSNALVGLWRAVTGNRQGRRQEEHRVRSVGSHVDPGTVRPGHPGSDLAICDFTGGDRRHDGPCRGWRPDDRRRYRGRAGFAGGRKGHRTVSRSRRPRQRKRPPLRRLPRRQNRSLLKTLRRGRDARPGSGSRLPPGSGSSPPSSSRFSSSSIGSGTGCGSKSSRCC